MTALATLQSRDLELFELLLASGDASKASYYATGSVVEIPDCLVIVDRGVSLLDASGVVVKSEATTVTALVAQIGGVPLKGARFVVDGTTYKVDSVNTRDGSRVECVVVV